MFSSLGLRAFVATGAPRARYDVLIALHAFKTAEVVRWSKATHPDRPVVVALTGTDLYRDIHEREAARRSLRLADRLVVLHQLAVVELPRGVRAKVRLVRQSADAVPRPPRKRSKTFDVALVAHLRDEKDPLRAAAAVRLLPPESRVRVLHAGRALSDSWERRALAEEADNKRYTWLGERAPASARRLIASADLLVLTSLLEGGANVLGEAIMSGTPVLATRIPAVVSALGRGYRGLFPVKDTETLARLFWRAEREPSFVASLAAQTRARRSLFAKSAERRAWRSLLNELVRSRRRRRRSAAVGSTSD